LSADALTTIRVAAPICREIAVVVDTSSHHLSRRRRLEALLFERQTVAAAAAAAQESRWQVVLEPVAMRRTESDSPRASAGASRAVGQGEARTATSATTTAAVASPAVAAAAADARVTAPGGCGRALYVAISDREHSRIWMKAALLDTIGNSSNVFYLRRAEACVASGHRE